MQFDLCGKHGVPPDLSYPPQYEDEPAPSVGSASDVVDDDIDDTHTSDVHLRIYTSERSRESEGRNCAFAHLTRWTFCRWCMAFVIVSVSFIVFPLLVILFEGQPFLSSCKHGWHAVPDANITDSLNEGQRAYTITLVIPAAFMEAPAALWLLSKASTPHLKDVSVYLFVLWLYQATIGARNMFYCSSHHSVIDRVFAAIYNVLYIICVRMGLKLILARLAALEASSFQNLHIRSYTKIAFGIGGGMSFFIILLTFFSFYWPLVAVTVLCLAFGVWIAFVLRIYVSARGLARQAMQNTTGRRMEVAKLAYKTATWQLFGTVALILSTFTYIVSWLCVMTLHRLDPSAKSRLDFFTWLKFFLLLLDSKANLFGGLALSGAFFGAVEGGMTRSRQEEARIPRLMKSRLAWQPCEHAGWALKIEELAYRGFTLEALLKFYKEDLPQQMPDFNPAQHRTSDVVRRAIMPLSRHDRCANATIMMNGMPTIPMKMVTHNWGNLFRDLVAAILADALGEDEYELLAHLLDHDIQRIHQWVVQCDAASQTYWVCAFSVSQHSAICSTNPNNDRDPITGKVHDVCDCGARKHFNHTEPLYKCRSVACEMNKFDEMMAYLAAHNPNFEQVIAVDAMFALFTRAWCVAEISKAYVFGMKQKLKLLNFQTLERNAEGLRNLRIEKMSASRPEDVQEILVGIPDVPAFNRQLQKMLFENMFPQWKILDAHDQMAVIGKIMRWEQTATIRRSLGMYEHRDVSICDGLARLPTSNSLQQFGF